MTVGQVVPHIRDEHKRKHVFSKMYGEKRPYSCHVCKASLHVDFGQAVHLCNLLPPGRNISTKCEKCAMEFKSRDGLLVHLTSDHGKTRPFKCTHCDWTSRSGKGLYHHIKLKHEYAALEQPRKVDPMWKCEFCEKGYSNRATWRTHLIRKHNQPKIAKGQGHFPCELCPRVFDNGPAILLHMTMKHNQPSTEQSTCEICGLVLASKSILKHIREEHVSDEHLAKIPCRCEKCNTDFTSSIELNIHLASCLNEPMSFRCKKCSIYPDKLGQRWHSGTALRRHIAEIHKKDRQTCAICGAILKDAPSFRSHMQAIHCGGVPLAFTCEHCGKSFPKKYQMKIHIQSVHEKKKPYPCSDCDKMYPTESTLKVHINAKHTKEIKYQCPHCSYFTYLKGVIPKHILEVHERAKPHKCKSCNAEYFYKRGLANHFATHPDHDSQ
jgi:KRAB domain-containing zinc finger protein